MNRSTTITALALASLLALAGCAGASEETTEGSAPETTASSPAAASSSAAPSTSASAAESAAAGAGISAEHNDADTMFAQMMIPHHEQAVTMSQTLLAKDDVPEEVRELAEGVIAAQGPEIERMQQMLETWGEPTSMASEGMEGMDHGSMDSESSSGMDGMMSEEDTTALEEAQGVEAARLYLQQMTIHHEGAIEMARGEVANGTNPEGVELAEDVVAAQEAEIAEMDQLLQGLPSQS